jgi:zinc D-Ala-D-Ala carboxypeptidase
MSRISQHLTLKEVIRSNTAARLGINNNPTPKHLENLKIIAEKIFEPIRLHFGKPITVSSGYRSDALNRVTPGSSATSQHRTGEALDLDQDSAITGVTNRQVFDFIKDNLEFDQLVWEYGTDDNPDWVHVSYRASGRQRRQSLRCTRVKGKPHYTPYE